MEGYNRALERIIGDGWCQGLCRGRCTSKERRGNNNSGGGIIPSERRAVTCDLIDYDIDESVAFPIVGGVIVKRCLNVNCNRHRGLICDKVDVLISVDCERIGA